MTDRADAAPAGSSVIDRFRRVRLRWWQVSIIVVAVVLTAEVGVRMIESDLPPRTGSEQRALSKARQMDARDRTRVVVIGSSEAAAGIRPAVLLEHAPSFETAYNAALVGSDIPVTEAWYRRVVEPDLDPDIVVIGLLPFTLLSFGVDLDGDPDFEHLPELARWADLMNRSTTAYDAMFTEVRPQFFGRIGWEAHERSALIRNRSQLRSPTITLELLFDRLGVERRFLGSAEDRDLLGGQTKGRIESQTGPLGESLEYTDAGEDEVDPDAVPLYRYAAESPLDLDGLGSLVDTVRRSGAQPVLALAPIDRVVLARSGVDLATWDRLAEQLIGWADEHGVPVDDQLTVTYAPEEFHDRHHVSADGASRWSSGLGRRLEELCRDGELSRC